MECTKNTWRVKALVWKSLLSNFELARTFCLSLLPGLFWVTYLRSLSAGRVSVSWLWALSFLAGWVSTELTLFLSASLNVRMLEVVPFVGSLLYWVLGVGLVEEGAKALCAVVFLKWFKESQEPLFILQLCGGVALGFATTENLLYATRFGDSVLIGRFLFSTLGHILFSSLWGFALGSRWHKSSEADGFERRVRLKPFFTLLLVSGVVHGLFNWFLFTGRPVLVILLLVVLWLSFREVVLGTYLRQEYRRGMTEPTCLCSNCSVLTRASGRYCSFCGEILKPEHQDSEKNVESLAKES